MDIDSRDRILVVDDNDANRYVLSRLLQKAGYQVLEAKSVAEAESSLSRPPVLIVLDVNLPDEKGTVFTKRLKSVPATSQIMVLNLSASFTRTKDRVDGLENGADGYLFQPIDPQEFLATVRALLRTYHAEEKVRRKNHDLELFAYAISHDLQEPLRMVSSFLELLTLRSASEGVLNEKQSHYVAFARDAAKRMRTMIADLMSLTAADQGGIKHEVIDMRAVIDAALNNLSMMIKDSKPNLVIAAMPSLMGDRGLLTQVFQNLLSNAVKYRSEQPLEITIRAEQSNDFQVFTITDNGIGIPATQLENIFAIFKRLHSHADIPGSGIGLALCKKIIEVHGGSIGCSSQVGTGSTFWFSLPMMAHGPRGQSESAQVVL